MLPGGRDVIISIFDNSSGPGTRYRLYKENLQTRAETDIATAPEPAEYLSVSPAGNAVAYDQISGVGDSPAGIYVQKLDGSPRVRISPDDMTANGGPGQTVSWSHDGTDIAYRTYYSADQSQAIVYAPASGSKAQTTVIRFPYGTIGGLESLAWTPNDQGILFNSFTGHVDYVNRGGGAVTHVAAPANGGALYGLAVDQHWDVFMSVTASSQPGRLFISAVWLGNTGAFTTISDTSGFDGSPSVDTSRQADPAPAGFGAACPALTMIAARGSGEPPQGDGPGGWTDPSSYTLAKDRDEAGHELHVLYTTLQQAHPALVLDPVMYPADAVFPDLVTGIAVYRASVASAPARS